MSLMISGSTKRKPRSYGLHNSDVILSVDIPVIFMMLKSFESTKLKIAKSGKIFRCLRCLESRSLKVIFQMFQTKCV